MKHTIQKGFTLVEMMAVLAIFSILTGITLFNYGKFRSDTILTNMAYEVALSIRETQIYGVSARTSATIGTGASKPYGIYFNTSGDNAKNYILFVDGDNGKKFDGSTTSCSGAGPGTDICVTTYSLQQNVKISNLQIKESGSSCTNVSGNNLSILFERPNLEPVIDGARDKTLAVITLTAAGGGARYVVVYNNGQIAVLNESEITSVCS